MAAASLYKLHLSVALTCNPPKSADIAGMLARQVLALVSRSNTRQAARAPLFAVQRSAFEPVWRMKCRESNTGRGASALSKDFLETKRCRVCCPRMDVSSGKRACDRDGWNALAPCESHWQAAPDLHPSLTRTRLHLQPFITHLEEETDRLSSHWRQGVPTPQCTVLPRNLLVVLHRARRPGHWHSPLSAYPRWHVTVAAPM